MEQQEWEYKNTHTVLKEKAESQGSKVYIESPDQGKNITYEQTYAMCNKIANFLKEKGMKVNDTIALISENSIETLLIYLGVLSYGAIVCPINVEESKENVYHLLNRAKPRIVVHGKELTFDQERYKADFWIPFADFDVDSGQENEFFSMLKHYSPEFDSPLGTEDDVAELIFTSGTTAIPKGVAVSRQALYYQPLDTVDRLKIIEQDVILDYRAYSWNSPQILSILPSLYVGATLVFAKKFSRTRFPSWLKDNNVTVCVGVPAVFNILLEQKVPLHKRDVPSLRFMTSSTAPLLVKNQLRFEEEYGIPINQGAGSSETGWMGMNDPEKRRLGSIGPPPRFKEVLILDKHGNKLPNGQEGELVIRGKSLGLGYIGPEGEINKFPEDGFHTGDLGYIDSDGYLYITGRKKDIIIRGGVNISPMEITSWLMEHPAVQEAVTIGVPDKVRGEEVASFIVPKEGETIDEEAIIEHCKKKLPDFKIPKTIHFLKEIPKTERAKLSKPGLLKIWEAKQGKSAEGGVISYTDERKKIERSKPTGG